MNVFLLSLGISSEAILEGLLMTVVGMAVVFVVLLLVMGLLYGMRWLPSEKETKAAPTIKPDAPRQAATDSGATDGRSNALAPEILAVISAAVIAAVGSNARIRSIRLALPHETSAWAGRGRSRHHQSHRVHRVKR